MTTGAWKGNQQLMLTASHCTSVFFSLDAGATRQNNSGSHFGFEAIDPSSYYCGTFFSPHRRCRFADVAAYDVSNVDLFPDDTIGWVPGRIARTIFPIGGTSQTPGPLFTNENVPYWTVVAEVSFPLDGEILHKVGVTNGWTFGAVYETCVDTSSNGIRFVCTDKANMFARGGDSGAPVFVPIYGPPANAVFYGVVFGQQGGASAVFSNLNQMKQDLGNIRFF